MTSTPTADAFLLGGGSKSASFENVGDTITGTVVSTEVRQQTDLQGNPRVWDNGDPQMQLVVQLQTTERADADDDGIRAVYVKGSKKIGSRSLHDAVASAVRTSGAKGLEAGGTLTVRFVGTEPSSTRGFNDRKLYEATYAAPDRAAESGSFLGTQQPATPAPVAQPAPAPQPAAAPAAPPTPEQLAAFAAWQQANQQAG